MPPTQAIMMQQLEKALEPITREINDMRDELRGMRKIITGNGTGIGLDEQVRNNKREIDRHEEQLRDIKGFMELLKPVIIFYKVGVWLAALIGVSIITLIWGMVTGQVKIVIP